MLQALLKPWPNEELKDFSYKIPLCQSNQENASPGPMELLILFQRRKTSHLMNLGSRFDLLDSFLFKPCLHRGSILSWS